MKQQLVSLAAMLVLSTAAYAAEVKTYQVTGPVIESTADSITVQKGSEKWQIGKDAGTKGGGDLKPGDKVTVMYRMTATSIDAKASAARSSKKK